jgi:ABC-2 type transport system ATP-binding protein
MAQPAIQVENVCKYFGPILAVNHIHFEVEPGEIVGFLGPNGAGKSTTIRILTSYLPASSGIAKVAGHDVMYESMQVREHIGYLPESVPLYPEMRVEEYLAFRAKLKGVDRNTRESRIDGALERCRIREVRRRLIGTLSKGYRQRVGLADAMLHDPPILILDEPTSGLDPVQIQETLNAIRELGRDHTVLLSTHILSEVEKVCDRVLIIHQGRIRLDSTLKDLAAEASVTELEVRGPVDAVTKMLQETAGVESVKALAGSDGVTAYEVRTHHDKDLREAIYQRLAGHKDWSLRRLDVRRPKLEDHYTRTVLRAPSAEVSAN